MPAESKELSQNECARLRKIDKNKSKETIADELELSVEEVEKYIQLIEDDKCNS